MGQDIRIGMYANAGGRFDNPDDQLAFIEANAVFLSDDARKFAGLHGKGMIVLHGQPGPFILATYFVPSAPGEFGDFSPKALAAFEEYDPDEEMLIGATDPAGTFMAFQRTPLINGSD